MSAIDRIKKKRQELEDEKKNGKKTKLESSMSKISDMREQISTTGKLDLPSNTIVSPVSRKKSTVTSPIKTTTKKKEDDEKKWYQKIFTKGEFDDGYQFGDITKTLSGTSADLVSEVAKGILSPIESVADIGANALASGAKKVGWDSAEKNLRSFANGDLTETLGNIAANTTPTGWINNIVNGTPENIINPAGASWDKDKSVVENVKTNYKNLFTDQGKEKGATSQYEDSSLMGEYAEKVTELVGYGLSLAYGGAALSGATKTAKIGTSTLGATANAGNIGINLFGKTLNIPTLALAGGMAGGLEEANSKEDVTELERWTKALSSGAIEGITEGMFSMLKVGGITNEAGQEIFDVAASKLSSKFKSQLAKTLTAVGVKATGESIEELVSYGANWFADNNIIDKLGQADFSKEWDKDEVLEQMALAFVSAGISQGGSTVIETNSAIQAAEEQLGRKLTNEEKALVTQASLEGALENKVAELEQRVTQEQTTQEQVQPTKTVEQLDNEIIELESQLNENLSDEQYNAITEQIKIRENQIEQIENGTNQISPTTTQEVETNSLVDASSNTLETGNRPASPVMSGQQVRTEEELRRSNFTYNSQNVTNEYARSTYESATKVMNDTERSHKIVDVVAKIATDRNTSYEFTNNEDIKNRGYNIEGVQVNGLLAVNENGESKVLINIDSPKALNAIVGHETTHLLEGTKEYAELQKAIFEYAKTKGDLKDRQAKLYSLYKNVNGADVNSELTADLVGDYLFTDSQFIESLSVEKPTIFQKIKSLIDDLVVRFKGTPEERQLREVQKKFREAYRNKNNSTEARTQYSMVGKKGVDRLVKKDGSYQFLADSYNKAVEMKKKGKSNKEIWEKTLWIQDKNGDWKFEISEEDAKLKLKPEKNTKYKLKELLKHDDLYEIYPETQKITVRFKNIKDNIDPDTGKKRMIAGYYNPITGTIRVNNKLIDMKNGYEHIVNTIIHEVQHKIQKYEGFDYGYKGSDEAGYFKNLGEREAKDTERRRKLSYKERSKIAPISLFEENSNSMYNSTNGVNANENNQKNKTILSKSLWDSNERSTNDGRGSQSNAEEIENPYFIDEELDNSSFFDEENSKKLEERVTGDDLLDAQDLIEEVKSVGAKVDDNGYVTVYHATTPENAKQIKATGKMKANEPAVFFSTSKNAQQSEGRGGTTLEFKIPAEKLILDDIFSDNADLKVPLKNYNTESLDVTEYLVDDKSNYRGSHQIENAKKVTELDLNDVQNKVIELNGYLTNQDYTDLNKLKKMLKKPNENVKIFRASPVHELNSGDWVTTDKAYAKNVASQNGGKVYEYEVNPSQLYYPDNVKELPSLHRLSSFQYNGDNMYSLSNPNEQISPIGNFNVYGEDVKLQKELAPIREDSAIQETDEIFYHGTGTDFDVLKSTKQLREEGVEVETANIGSNSEFVYLGDKTMASSYASARKTNSDSKSKGYVKPYKIKGKVIDLTKPQNSYSEADMKIFNEISDELIKKSDSRGADAVIAASFSKAGRKSVTSTPYIDVNYSQLENTKYLGEVLRKYGISGIKFADQTTYGATRDSMAILPDAVTQVQENEQLQEELAPIKEATKEIKQVQKEVSKQVKELKQQIDDFKALTKEQYQEFDKMYQESLSQLQEEPVQEDAVYDELDTISLDDKNIRKATKDFKKLVALSKTDKMVLDNTIKELSKKGDLTVDDIHYALREYEEFHIREKNDFVVDVRNELASIDYLRIPRNFNIDLDMAELRDLAKGRLKFKMSDNPNVDTVYEELSEQYPQFFPDDIMTPSQQFEVMVDVASTPIYEEQRMTLPDDMIREEAQHIYDVIQSYREWEKFKASEKSYKEYKKLMKGVEAPTIEEELSPVQETKPVKEEISKEAFTKKVEELSGEIKNELGYIPKDPRKAEAYEYDEEIAEILTEEPTTEKGKKNKLSAWFKANILDKGLVFEDISLKHKNRELQAKWDYTLTSEARAQYIIGNGHEVNGVKTTKSLNEIREEVESTGLSQLFSYYLYNKHNVDRMNLSKRFEGMKDKPVFGYSMTSEKSQAIVDSIEQNHPEFKKFAQDVYDYVNADRAELVKKGVISQETAVLWGQMYPHYVPIRRVDHNGNAINVPLDTNRTGINAPIKKATGGNSDILPLFDTMAQRTIQTQRATAKNSFGIELKNTIKPKSVTNNTNIDEVVDNVDNQESLLQEGKNGQAPTFTVFEKGKKVTYEITEEMYEALKPISDSSILSKTIKPLNTASNIHRGLLTQYNIFFALKNGIKDAQDLLINSQHPLKTYSKIPEAYAQILGKGHYYNEYMRNGGEQNSYFDSQEMNFDTKPKGLAKATEWFPLKQIAQLNDFIEMVPRLSEYIASRQSGRSIETSMLDAARVTTNFKAGGNVTKFANRNGATFLNASVQGAMQQVRNIREANMNGLKGWANLATKFTIAGLPAILLNALLWDDDEEYEELSDYVKQNYYIVGKYGDGQFIRIPKGRTTAVIQDAIQQISNAATGNDEVDMASFLQLAATNLAPTNPLENNIFAPIIQAATNKTWYGDDLVPQRLQDLPAAEQYDETTDSFSRWLGEKTNISPIKMNYLLNQYSGVVGDIVMPMITPKATQDSDNALLAPLKDIFTVDGVMKNQNVSDFYETSEKLTTGAKSKEATDEDILKNKYFNSVKTELNDLYAQKREIQSDETLSKSEKYKQAKEVQKQINKITENALSEYGDGNYTDNYGIIDDREYYKDDNGDWKAVNKEERVALNEMGLTLNEKSQYVTIKQELDSIKEEYSGKGDDYSNEKERRIINTITGTNLSEDAKVKLYKRYYNSDKIDQVMKANISSDIYFDYVQQEFKADYNAKGNAISGSRKAKVIAYVNEYEMDIPQKAILIKSTNTFKFNEYNNEIVDYVAGLDITYEEKVQMLEDLDMKVYADGTVRWD